MNTKHKTYLFETDNINNNWDFICNLKNDCDYIIMSKTADKIQGFIRFKYQRHIDSVSRTVFNNRAILTPSSGFDIDYREKFMANTNYYENGKPLRKKRKSKELEIEKEEVERRLMILKEENEQKTKQLELQTQLIHQQSELLKQSQTSSNVVENDNFQQLMNMCLTLVKSNATVAENLTVYSNSVIQNQNSNNNNNSKIKNKFNLNLFLNEQCKDAINLIDFVKGIQLELNDMILHNQVGYADAISTIFNKELNKMDLTKRPVHCTDLKREVIYVKDDGKWHNDENRHISDKAITILSTRNYMQMQKWKEENPNYLTNREKNIEYIKLTKNLMGGSTDQEQDANSKKIIKSIAKTTHIDKEDTIV
jgi:hypothetical protein